MGVPGITAAFSRELEVSADGQRYWLPVQEVLVRTMSNELRAGETIELFVIYIGQIGARHLFLINAFDHDDAHGIRR